MKRFLLASLVVSIITALLSSSAGGWSNVYGTDGANDYSSAEAVELLDDGSAIVAGCFDGEFNGKTATNGLDTFVMKLSPEGETLWTYTEDGPYGSDPDGFGSDCLPLSIRVDALGNIFAYMYAGPSQDHPPLSDVVINLAADGEPLDTVLPGLNRSWVDGLTDGVSGYTLVHPIPGWPEVPFQNIAVSQSGQVAGWKFDSVSNAVLLSTCQIEDCDVAAETQISQVPDSATGEREVMVEVTSNDTIVLAANHGDENAHLTLCLAGDCAENRRDFSVPVGNSSGAYSLVSIDEFADGTPSVMFSVSGKPAVVVSCTDATCTSLNEATVDVASVQAHAVASNGLVTLVHSSTGEPVVLFRCDDLNCTTVSSATLDRTGDSWSADFDADDNLVLLLNSSFPVLAWCDDAACSSTSAANYDTENRLGVYPSLFLSGDGVAWLRPTGNTASIVRCERVTCEYLPMMGGHLVDVTATGYSSVGLDLFGGGLPGEHYLTQFHFGDFVFDFRNWAQIMPAANGLTVLGVGRYRTGQERPTVVNVSADGEQVWAWQPTYPAEYEIDDYQIQIIRNMSRSDGAGGLIVVARHTPAVTYKQTDLAVYRIAADGEELWSTLINGSCVSTDSAGDDQATFPTGAGDWSFISGSTIVLDSPSCASSSEQAARVLSLETGAVITEYDDAELRGESMLTAYWPEPDCYEANDARTLVVFLYDRCDSDLPVVGNQSKRWNIQMQYSVDEFADLGDGRVAALVNLTNPELHDDPDPYYELPGRWFGVFEVVADGFLRPLKFEQIVATNGENDSLRDVAVDPVSGRVVVVGRVDGESSVTLNSLSRSGSVRSSQPNALTVSASSEVVPITHGFDDVALSGWRNDAVYWMRSSGVTTGCSATEFCPDQEMTREQQITFLWRYAGEPSPGAASPFSDVAAGRYYTNPVSWAYNNGITNGVSPTSFGTGRPITRAQAVTFLWRQAGEPVPSGANPFVDVPAGTYYTDPVRWAFENRITTGTSPTTFAPNQAVTRVQFAAFLSRYDNLNLN